MKFVDKYTGPGNWTGSAATVGSGIQAMELFKEAFAQEPKKVIVGGECAVSTVRSQRFNLPKTLK
jgi:hypothetical protein